MTTWHEIVTDHGPIVVRLARRILGAGPDAENVVQEVFLEVFRLRQREAVSEFSDLSSCEPRRRHFAEYLTGLMVAANQTVTGINGEFVETADQSCLNRFIVTTMGIKPSPSGESSNHVFAKLRLA